MIRWSRQEPSSMRSLALLALLVLVSACAPIARSYGVGTPSGMPPALPARAQVPLVPLAQHALSPSLLVALRGLGLVPSR